MCTLRLRGRYQKITLINVHAPHEENNVEAKEEYYNELDKIYEEIPKYDIKLLLGDTNAKIGKEKLYRPTIGAHSKHLVTNENGQFLIDFAKEKNMTIVSTYFQRKEIHKGTWRSPDGKTINQIDHVMIEKPEVRCIKNVRSYRGLDADTDHFMVGVKIKQLIPESRNQTAKKARNRRTVRLQSEEEKIRYENMISNELEKLTEEGTIEEIWTNIKTKIEKTAKKCSKEIRKEWKEWFDTECKRELEVRRKLRLKMLQEATQETKNLYEQQRRKTKTLLRRKKREYYENLLKQIEEDHKNNEIRNLYKGVKKERRGYQSRPICCKDKEGQIIAGEEEVLHRWKEYFDQLLNGNGEMEKETKEQISNMDQENIIQAPSTEDIKEIIKKLKNNKSPGEDNIPVELFKYGGQNLINQFQKLLQRIWEREEMPREWTGAIICPIHKKGDKRECHNYRGIALLNVAYKILSTYIKNKLVEEVENKLGEYQCGFRPGRSTVDQIFTLREIQAESFEYKKPTLVLFIDFQQAYDRIKRAELHEVLKELGISQKLRSMIFITLQGTENRVKINNRTTEKFLVREGVRQGDPLSSVLFSLVLEKVIQDSKINRSGLMYQKKHQCLAFADDLVILARSKTELKEVIQRLEEQAQKRGLYINETKTKYMEWTDEEFQKDSFFKLNTNRGKTYKFEEVEQFTYLGTLFARKPNIRGEIEARIMSGNRGIATMQRILRNKNISRQTKLRLYKTVIRPIVTYASETWTLNTAEQIKLEIWERKVLRKIFGGKKTEEGWVRRSNEELKTLYKETNIIGIVRSQRLRWLGHIERMSEERVPRMIITRTIGGKKRQGRPRTRWKTDVERDLRQLKIINWKQKAKDREQWKRIVSKAMGRLGAQC